MTLPEILLYLEDTDGKTPDGRPSLNPLQLQARVHAALELRKQHPLTRLRAFQR